MTKTHVARILDADTIRFGGMTIKGDNAGPELARQMIAAGYDPEDRLELRWPGYSSGIVGPIRVWGMSRYSEGGAGISRTRWAPHPKVTLDPVVQAWYDSELAKIEARKKEKVDG